MCMIKGSFSNYLTWISQLRKAYKNYVKVALNLFRGKKQIEIITRFNEKFILPNLYVKNYAIAVSSSFLPGANPLFNIKDNYMEFTYKDKRLRFYGFLLNGHVYNQFISFEYGKIDFKNKTVIDIGANIGDSSIYFAINGAKEVYAIEPMPKLFNYLTENIRFNNITNIIPLNVAIGNEEGLIKIPNIDVGLDAYTKNFQNSENGNIIPVKTLRSIISEYVISENIVLKIDCEGCEYDAIYSLDNTTLDKISQIALEYHYGPYKLSEFLIEKGFKVEYTKPKRYNEHEIGILYAFK